MSTNQVNILFQAGRVVGGSCYKGRTHNKKGELLLFKSGVKKGQPRTDWSLGVAYPKNGTTHFNQTPWGKLVYDEAVREFPRGEYQQPAFSWKIQDGDSTVPNKEMRRNCDRVGYPGHWIVWFGGTNPPQLAKLENKRAVPFLEPNGIKPGYWVQVSGSTKRNDGETAGMYMNQHIVCLVGIDEEIAYGPDLESVGFGEGVALPAGVSMTNFPTAATLPLPAFEPPVHPAYSSPAQVAAVPPVTQTAVTPHPSFLTPSVPLPSAPMGLPALPVPNPVLAPPLPPAEPRMTAAAQGATYAQMLAGGWTPDLMRQHGMLA